MKTLMELRESHIMVLMQTLLLESFMKLWTYNRRQLSYENKVTTWKVKLRADDDLISELLMRLVALLAKRKYLASRIFTALSH